MAINDSSDVLYFDLYLIDNKIYKGREMQIHYVQVDTLSATVEDLNL